MRGEIRRIAKEFGLTAIYVTHDQKEALSVADRLAIMDRGRLVQAALRAQAAIVPVAIIGAEEALPALARMRSLSLMAPLPLPAKFRIRFLEPVPTEDLPARSWEQESIVLSLTEDIRALIQENLLELVAERRSVWLG